jgi:hypothetical protein
MSQIDSRLQLRIRIAQAQARARQQLQAPQGPPRPTIVQQLDAGQSPWGGPMMPAGTLHPGGAPSPLFNERREQETLARMGPNLGATPEALAAGLQPGTRSIVGEGLAAAAGSVTQALGMEDVVGPGLGRFTPSYAPEDASGLRNAAQYTSRLVGGVAPLIAAGAVAPVAPAAMLGTQGISAAQDRGASLGAALGAGAINASLGMVPVAGALGRLSTAPGVRGVVTDMALGAGGNVLADVGGELAIRAGGGEAVPLTPGRLGEQGAIGLALPAAGRAVRAGMALPADRAAVRSEAGLRSAQDYQAAYARGRDQGQTARDLIAEQDQLSQLRSGPGESLDLPPQWPEPPRAEPVPEPTEPPAPTDVPKPKPPVAKPRRSREGEYKRADIEARLVEAHQSIAPDIEVSDEMGSMGGHFVWPGDTYPGEAREMMTRHPELKRLFRLEKNARGSRAGAEDLAYQMGWDKYEQYALESAGSKYGAERVRAAKEFFTANQIDPELAFLATLHDNLPRTNAGIDAKFQSVKPDTLPVGTRFEIDGTKFRVESSGDGYKVIIDHGQYPEVRAENMPPIPVDKGSLEKPSALSGGRGLYGQASEPITGTQRALFETRPDIASEAAREAEAAQRERTRESDLDRETGPLFSPRAGSRAPLGTSWKLAQPKTMTGEAKAQVRIQDIHDQMRSMTGVPIRFGHGDFARHKAAGWFDPGRYVIRNRRFDELNVAAHEFGHALHDHTIGWNNFGGPAVRRELIDLGRQLYGNRKPNGGYGREGVAEFVARRLLGEDMSKSAPLTQQWFDTQILGKNPKFAEQWGTLADQYRRWDIQGAPGRVAAQIDQRPKGLLGLAKRAVQDVRPTVAIDRLARYLTNDAAPLERAEGRLLAKAGVQPGTLLAKESPSKLRQAVKSSAPGTARHFIENYTTNLAGDRTGGSLVDALRPVRKNLADWESYAVARRAIDLHERGINPGISLEDARSTVQQLETPTFRKALDDVTEYANHVMDYVVEAGGLSREAADAMRIANPIYVPFKRLFTQEDIAGPKGLGTGRGQVNTGTATKRIKGSGRPIVDPVESIAMQTEQMIAIANKARVGRALVDLAAKYPKQAWFAERVPTPKRATTFTLEQLRADLHAAGADLTNADLDQIATVYSNAPAFTGKEPIVSIWRNGEREFWQLDPEIYRVVTEMDKEVLPSWFTAIVGPPKRLVQLGATGLNPAFSLVSNPLRDAMTWNIFRRGERRGLEKLPAVGPMAMQMRGLWQELRKDPGAQRWEALGGKMTTIMGQDRAAAGRRVQEGLATGRGEKAIRTARHPIDSIRDALGAFEGSPRIVEFTRVYERELARTGDKQSAAIEAMIASKEATVDFTRAGTLTQAINQAIPFFNAAVQGTSRMVREGVQHPVRMTARAFVGVTIPSLLIWYMHKDDEWYQELPTWQRERYWNFSFDGGKRIVKMPKPFELGMVFGTLPEMALDSMYRKDPRAVSEAVFDTLVGLMPVDSVYDLVPAVIKPSVEVVGNYDAFSRRQIVPQHEQESRPPAEQFGAYTTETAKRIGEWLNVSPRKVEHVISGYTGGAGVDAARWIESWTGVRKLAAGDKAADLPVVGRLFSRDPLGRGATVERFYEALTDARQRAGSRTATDADLERYQVLHEAAIEIAEFRRGVESGEVGEADARRVINEIASISLTQDLQGRRSVATKFGSVPQAREDRRQP